MIHEGPACFCILDRTGRFEFASLNALTVLGRTADSLLGSRIQEHLVAEDFARHGEFFTLRSDSPFGLRQLVSRVQAGASGPLKVHWTLLPNDQRDALLCMVRSAADDPDDLLRATLKELSDFKRALDEHAIVAVTDAAGRITHANDKFCAISKYSRAELLGQDHRIINSGTHPKDFFRDLWTVIKYGAVWHGEIRNRAKDGSTYWVDTTIVPFLGSDGAPERFVAIRADITQRKEAEAALMQSQKLESLGILAGGIAHDFNNLLTTVLGNANLAAAHLPADHPASPFLARIEEASLRAADLTRQLLAYAGKGKLQVDELDLNFLVKEMTRLLSVSISKKADIRYMLSPEPCWIHADISQIQQVVMNLVTNASEAIGSDNLGRITVRTGEQELDEAYVRHVTLLPLKPGRYAILEVSDTGCGMDAATLARIFDPFFTTKFTGRGLGLAAMIGTLRSHAGSLKVYSEVGRGTTFKIYLPSSRVALASQVEKPSAPLTRSLGTLLVVDDEPTVRQVARALGISMGFHVVEAVDGMEAVEVFRRGHPEIALVLMDLTMPRMDGYQAFAALQEIDAAVPVVLSSGYSELETGDRQVMDRLAGFLPKPYQKSRFEEVVKQALATRRGSRGGGV